MASGASGDEQDRHLVAGSVEIRLSISVALPVWLAGWGRRPTLPLTLHGKFEQKSCVFENGRSVSGAGVLPPASAIVVERGLCERAACVAAVACRTPSESSRPSRMTVVAVWGGVPLRPPPHPLPDRARRFEPEAARTTCV